MPLRILDLPSMFRPGTSHVYPPFKKGRYMEEYVYDYLMAHAEKIDTEWVYLPIYWTHLQNHPNFSRTQSNFNLLLHRAILSCPPDTVFFTVVQHDDGPQLHLPPDTIVFGACAGSIPLPLLYEDTDQKLSLVERHFDKHILASFVGTSTTHPIRGEMVRALEGKAGIVCRTQMVWSPSVPDAKADLFVQLTLSSKFCLAPRGYGRSSFRFFEAMLMDVVPVYVWDDVEWLPYLDQLDYSSFAISVKKEELPFLYDRLAAITDEQYYAMVKTIKKVRHYFTLEGMCEYIVDIVTRQGKCFGDKSL